MKITREQYAQLRSICKRFNVPPNTVHLKKVVTVDKRVLKRRVVLISRLKWSPKRKSATIVYNSAKRVDVVRRYLIKKPVKSRTRLWNKYVRVVRRRQMAKAPLTDSSFDDDNSNECTVESEKPPTQEEEQEVRDQLKTQLQLLQTRKQKSFCLDENSDELTMKGKLTLHLVFSLFVRHFDS